jgi:ubiquinone/menaquinone biosynthesis C-methylase UbiE
MSAIDVRRAVATTATSTSLVVIIAAACWGQTQTQTAQAPAETHTKGKVDPQINAQFQNANIKEFIKRFESNDREVFVKRREITKAVGLKPGMAVADIGAGTGLFTRLFADEVGSSGKVYAVDVSPEFLDHIAAMARKSGQTQIVTIRGTQGSTNLAPRSIDVAFLCDVYHHLENHEKVLASIHRALRPGGTLVLVEFDRVHGKSTEFVLKHVRAGRDEFLREIESAGFRSVDTRQNLKLRDNFLARFEKREKDRTAEAAKRKPSTVKSDDRR